MQDFNFVEDKTLSWLPIRDILIKSGVSRDTLRWVKKITKPVRVANKRKFLPRYLTNWLAVNYPDLHDANMLIALGLVGYYLPSHRAFKSLYEKDSEEREATWCRALRDYICSVLGDQMPKLAVVKDMILPVFYYDNKVSILHIDVTPVLNCTEKKALCKKLDHLSF